MNPWATFNCQPARSAGTMCRPPDIKKTPRRACTRAVASLSNPLSRFRQVPVPTRSASSILMLVFSFRQDFTTSVTHLPLCNEFNPIRFSPPPSSPARTNASRARPEDYPAPGPGPWRLIATQISSLLSLVPIPFDPTVYTITSGAVSFSVSRFTAPLLRIPHKGKTRAERARSR